MIDVCYALVLVVFKVWSNIPMSTTWVFLGILGGREFSLSLDDKGYPRKKKRALKLVMNDIVRASMGLLISLILVVYLI